MSNAFNELSVIGCALCRLRRAKEIHNFAVRQIVSVIVASIRFNRRSLHVQTMMSIYRDR